MPTHTIALFAAASLAAPALAQVSASPVGPERLAGERCLVAPSGPARPFTEESTARGISYTVGTPGSGITIYGPGGASFADLDGDGDPDIVITGADSGRFAVYENDGAGQFTERPGHGLNIPYGSGIIAADYDGDGDLDLYVSSYRWFDRLLRNEGGFMFTDVTAAAGLNMPVAPGGGCAFADVDGDGWLDLYVANRTGGAIPGAGPSTEPNRLFINQGDGTFVDMYAELGLTTGLEPTLVGAFIDFDLDGDPDLYEGNDKGSFCAHHRNELYENVGGTFVNITDQSGTQSCTDTMGIAIGDFDRNGWPDMYCTHTPNAPGNTLMTNNGDGTFDLMAPDYGVDSLALSWGAMFFDHDNDGDLALYVNNTYVPDRLYDYQGSWPAVDIGPDMGTHAGGYSYNTSSADIDSDGDLDLLVQLMPGTVQLLINHEGERRNWLKLKIRGEAPNHHAIGAHVRILAGGEWQSSQILAGGNNYRTQNSLDQHFGLGDDCTVDKIRVTWPGGETRTMTDYSVNARYTIHPPAKLGDRDDDGDITADDLRGLIRAFGPVRPGTEIYDMDGDARIGPDDLGLLVDKAIAAE